MDTNTPPIFQTLPLRYQTPSPPGREFGTSEGVFEKLKGCLYPYPPCSLSAQGSINYNIPLQSKHPSKIVLFDALIMKIGTLFKCFTKIPGGIS